MFGRSMALTAGVVLFGAAGCGLQEGHTIATFTPSSDLVMTQAPEDGRYALYTATGATPVTTYTLRRGDRLGFERDPNGRIQAVAASNVQPLSKLTTSAYWKEE